MSAARLGRPQLPQAVDARALGRHPGRRRPPPGRVRAVDPHRGVRLGRGLGGAPHADRRPRARPGRLRRPASTRQLSGDRAAAHLDVGRDDGPRDRLADHRDPPRAAGQHPQRRPVPRPAGSTRWSSRCAWSTATACGAATRPGRPAAVAELLRRHVATQELTVEAAVSGDRALVAQAFALDPLAGRGDLHETRGHGRRAAGRHRPVAAPARAAGPTRPPDDRPTDRRPRRTRMRLGFIGLGAMGLPMTRNLLDGRPHGDRRLTRARPDRRGRGPRRGRRRRSGRRGRGQRGRPPVRAQLARGRRGGGRPARPLGPGHIVVDCSTIDPDVERDQHRRVRRDRRVATSTRPLSGGTVGAETGTLTVMVGGDAATLDRAAPRARAGRGARWCTSGGPGMGQVVKLCNNLIYAAQMVATAEAAALATPAGRRHGQAARGAAALDRRLRRRAHALPGRRRGAPTARRPTAGSPGS